MLFMSCVFMFSRLFIVGSERAVYCDFVTLQFGILGQVWYLIVSIPDPCCHSYFENTAKETGLLSHCLLKCKVFIVAYVETIRLFLKKIFTILTFKDFVYLKPMTYNDTVNVYQASSFGR